MTDLIPIRRELLERAAYTLEVGMFDGDKQTALGIRAALAAPVQVDWREHSKQYARGVQCPDTLETAQAAWARDQEVIFDQKGEIAKLKEKVNQLQQKRAAPVQAPYPDLRPELSALVQACQRFIEADGCECFPEDVLAKAEWALAKDAHDASIRYAKPKQPAPVQDAGEAFCDGHCTWLDHQPGCPRAAPVQGEAVPKWRHDALIQHCKLQDKIIAKLRDERNTVCLYEQKEVWFWQGDGEDYLESLVCPVVIKADDLRALLTPPQPAEVGELANLLRHCASDMEDWRMSFPGANSTVTDGLLVRIDAALAKLKGK